MSKNRPNPHSQRTVVQQKFYQGIIPPPESMEHYDRINPGFANRILQLTEKESAHRHKMEKRIVGLSFFTTMLGQVAALGSVLVVCYLCYFAFDKGFASDAKWIAVSVLVSIASVFLYKRKQLTQ